jgi:uncharacterized FlaG/YvyC family protein
MPFGVELPDNLGEKPSTEEPSQDLAPGSAEGTEISEKLSNETSLKPPIEELLDLDKQERVRFEGREWSVKDLRNAYLMREDYTRKTQELAEARKYADNFDADLSTVLREPNRLSDFARIYPPSYVEKVQRILERANPESAQASSQGQAQRPAELPPEMRELLQFKQTWEQERKEQAIQSTQRELDTMFSDFGKKYEFANHKAVNNAAISVVEAGHKLTPQLLEKLFKQEHEDMKALFEKSYKNKVQAQKQAGFKARDAGPGGSAPGAAPKVNKTLREARDQWLSDLEAQK